MFDYRSHPDVARHQMWVPETVEEVREFIARQESLEPNIPGTWFQVAITLRDSGEMVGDCGLRFPVQEPAQVEVGITLSPDQQGRGYATETMRAVLGYAFEVLDKHRVYARVDLLNERSMALMERTGMRREGHLRESVWFKGEWADDLVFAMLEWEWENLGLEVDRDRRSRK
jgi:RimJ/RimL family protein N-acetyltransferase